MSYTHRHYTVKSSSYALCKKELNVHFACRDEAVAFINTEFYKKNYAPGRDTKVDDLIVEHIVLLHEGWEEALADCDNDSVKNRALRKLTPEERFALGF